jgi:S-adenosylmethionine:tRNA ribosyltransferase-isomerase
VRPSDFDFSLPPHHIAQHPPVDRTNSRLLVLDRARRDIEHSFFPRLGDYLRPGDLLVLNDSRVIPARLRGRKVPDGGVVEILLLEPDPAGGWLVLLRPGKRVRQGTRLVFEHGLDSLPASVLEKTESGMCRLEFVHDSEVLAFAERHGEVPLPPYITRAVNEDSDRERYQTVYADEPGSVAAPTAGLHFTRAMLASLRDRGVQICSVTLHVGLGTFAPVKAVSLSAHVMHAERFSVSRQAADAINRAHRENRRIVAVGTTSVRVLETAARDHYPSVRAGEGRTRLFLHPPADFLLTGALLTNFHLPRSTLLMLVSAFATPGATHGRDFVLHAYREAIEREYRFFSYGDAMLLI